MRADMAKVIVERPRIWYRETPRARAVDNEDLPAREGMRRRHVLRGDPKQLNENLSPLRRFLARQVGRPWNKVYAEIAANLRVDNTVQQHVRDHLRDFVVITPRLGVRDRWRSSRTGLWWQPFYVDPKTGLLCRTDRLPEEKARQRARRFKPLIPVERVALTDTSELRLIQGLWYAITLAPLPEPIYRTARETVCYPLTPWRSAGRHIEADMEVRRLVSAPVHDVACGELIEVGPALDIPEAWKLYRRTHPDRRYAVGKRTLSRDELRLHGLRNAKPSTGA